MRMCLFFFLSTHSIALIYNMPFEFSSLSQIEYSANPKFVFFSHFVHFAVVVNPSVFLSTNCRRRNIAVHRVMHYFSKRVNAPLSAIGSAHGRQYAAQAVFSR